VRADLLGNALVHGDPDGKVLVRLASGDSITLTVHNAGSAIPQSELARIFDPYRRGGATPSNGLGLDLVADGRNP
jgi:signal transduction histidine kinase